MKRLAYLILMKICVVFLLPATPASSAISPTNQMDAWTDYFGVHLRVYNPKNNLYLTHNYNTNDEITMLNVSNGIARWVITTPLGKCFVHALYDPVRYQWKIGQSKVFNTINQYDPSNYQESNGIVSGWGTRIGTWAPVIYVTYYSTYDPIKGEWISADTENQQATVYPFWKINQEGIVAFDCGSIANPEVRYYVYDYASGRGWREGIWRYYGPCDHLTVYQLSVNIESGANTYIRGYNPYTGAWEEGLSTAWSTFYADPEKGPCPLWVWFWDLSLGAYSYSNSRYWLFENGTKILYKGSCGYNYAKAGKYEVMQVVLGANSVGYSTDIIQVMGRGLPFLPLLLY